MERVNGNNHIDIGGGRRGFRSQNAAAGIPGTEVTANFLNDIQEEICAVIEKAGLVLNSENRQQLYEALQSYSAPGFANRYPWQPVISMSTTTPPSGATIGDAYVIPTNATGVWAGKSQSIAEWTGNNWRIFTPKNGHGIGLPDGRVFILIGGVYTEWLASRDWVNGRKTPMAQLNTLPWLSVKSITQTAPPATPAEGELYLIPAGATGAWVGKVGQIAEWSEAAWRFSIPADGHGISLPDGRVFERISGAYVEKLALDVQSGKWNYAPAAGTPNALTVNLTPTPDALVSLIGASIRVKVGAIGNTGPATLNVNDLGVKNVLRSDGTPLKAGDLPAGAVVFITYDGVNWQLSGVSGANAAASNSVSFTNPGTTSWTVPDGIYRILCDCWGGGGGGGGAGSTGAPTAGSGGGAGAYVRKYLSVTPGQVLNLIVGAGGVAGSWEGGNGGSGGSTSFGALLTALGGSGGKGVINSISPGIAGLGGVASGGDVNISGGGGGLPVSIPSAPLGGSGGPSYGTSSPQPNQNGNGFNGNIPGGGANGGSLASAGNFSGGAGARGMITISY